MVLYNLADTYFVGMLNDPVQNAAVTLAAPVLLAFNAVNNLFGVGSSSMMSRALGRKDYDTVCAQLGLRAFTFALFCGIALLRCCCTVFIEPLLHSAGRQPGNGRRPPQAILKWTVICGATPAILNVVMAYLVRAEGAALHASIGTMSGCLLNIVLDPIFILPWGLEHGGRGRRTWPPSSPTAWPACTSLSCCLSSGRHTSVCVRSQHVPLCKRPLCWACAAVGMPAAIQNLLNVTGMTVLNNFTSAFGSDAVAAMGITQKVNHGAHVYRPWALSQGIMPLVSYTYASGNYSSE